MIEMKSFDEELSDSRKSQIANNNAEWLGILYDTGKAIIVIILALAVGFFIRR